MPPKSSNKKTQATWYHCEACSVHITHKAREKHETVCPVSEDAANDQHLEFVRNGKLYTRSVQQRNFDIESLNDVPERYANALLFMSEGAIQLAKLHIGQHVVVTSAEANPLVRMVWPIPEQFLTTVFVNERDFKQNWSKLCGKLIVISALDTNRLTAAAHVYLKQQDAVEAGLDPSQLNEAMTILQHELVNLIFCKDSKLHFNFFNKSLTFLVDAWQGHLTAEQQLPTPDEVADAAQAFSRLSLEKQPEFFQVTNTTTLEVLSESSEKSAEDSHAAAQLHVITKADIGGLDRQVEIVQQAMEYALGYKQLPTGIKVSRGMLLYGATGCGKSMICEAMCAAAEGTVSKVQLIKINSGEIYSKFLGETEKNLNLYFERAYTHYPQPTLMLLEDVHNLCPKHETSEVVKRVSIAFLGMLDQLANRQEAQRTFLLATTSQIDALHPSIRRAGRLDCEIEIAAPAPSGRQAILNCLLSKVVHSVNETEIEQIAAITHGYVGADLANLVYTATLAALQDQARTLNFKDLNAALTQIKPSAMREVLIECPNVQWSDIGGQSALRLALQQAIEWPLQHPEKFQRLGIKPPRGILMFGPPGCSKTMIAKALATESKLNFLSIKGPELFSMWVGESERAVREVFRKARQVAPAIVFFDEIDAIGGERADGGAGGSGASVKERVLTQLLTELDGVETLQNVTIVAATNRPDMIDKALLRPGRIDRIVYVGLPADDARREILRIKLRSMPLADDVNIEALAERTAGYSGAEIQAVCHEAALHALEQSFDAEQVAWPHFEYALQAVQPRTSPELLLLYQQYMKQTQ